MATTRSASRKAAPKRKATPKRKTSGSKKPRKPCSPTKAGTPRVRRDGRCLVSKTAKAKAAATKRKTSGTKRRSPAKRASTTGPCKPTPKGTPRVRIGGKCLATTGAAARAAGVCAPRRGKDGVVRQTVAVKTLRAGVPVNRCVVAGGQAARDLLRGNAACPTGKVLKKYMARIPGSTTKVPASRCVKARGQYKNCRVGLVIAHSTAVEGRVCVKPETAAARGYKVLGKGTLRHDVGGHRGKGITGISPATPRRRAAGSRTRTMSAADARAADAIMSVVGQNTALSLMSGGRSQKLGAGMATMVAMTKKEAAKQQRQGTRRSPRFQ